MITAVGRWNDAGLFPRSVGVRAFEHVCDTAAISLARCADNERVAIYSESAAEVVDARGVGRVQARSFAPLPCLVLPIHVDGAGTIPVHRLTDKQFGARQCYGTAKIGFLRDGRSRTTCDRAGEKAGRDNVQARLRGLFLPDRAPTFGCYEEPDDAANQRTGDRIADPFGSFVYATDHVSFVAIRARDEHARGCAEKHAGCAPHEAVTSTTDIDALHRIHIENTRRTARGRGHRDILTARRVRSEEHTSELQSQSNLVCRLLLEKKNHPETELSRQMPTSTTSIDII